MAMNANGIDSSLIAADDSGFADSCILHKLSKQVYFCGETTRPRRWNRHGRGTLLPPERVDTSAQAATIISRIAALRDLSFGDAVYASVGTDNEISDDGYAMLASGRLVASEDRSAELTRADAGRPALHAALLQINQSGKSQKRFPLFFRLILTRRLQT